MMASLKYRRAGFTIVEVMIAIAIFTMIIIAIYSSWTAILRGSKVGLAEAAAAQRDRITMRSIEDALVTSLMFGENIRHYSFLADTSGDFAALSFVSHLPSSFPGSGLFGNQVVRRVTFMVEEGKEGPQLVMTQAPLLSADLETEPYSIVLARQVNEFILEFWDQRIMDWGAEWTATNQLPKLMRVSLSVGGSKTGSTVENAEVVSRVIHLPATIVQREWQLPGGIAAGRPPPGMDRGGTNTRGGGRDLEVPRGRGDLGRDRGMGPGPGGGRGTPPPAGGASDPRTIRPRR